MKIMIFTEGTIIMHKNAKGHSRKEIVEQVKKKEESVKDYASYIPIGEAVNKLKTWKKQVVDIIYLTSRRKPEEIKQIKSVLKRYDFPEGELTSRKESEEYKDVAERIIPDILVEDNCESIGGEKEMTITQVRPAIKKKIKSIIVKEFEGIDHLPDKLLDLSKV